MSNPRFSHLKLRSPASAAPQPQPFSSWRSARPRNFGHFWPDGRFFPCPNRIFTTRRGGFGTRGVDCDGREACARSVERVTSGFGATLCGGSAVRFDHHKRSGRLWLFWGQFANLPVSRVEKQTLWSQGWFDGVGCGRA